MDVINYVKDNNYSKVEELIGKNYEIHQDTLIFTLDLNMIKLLVNNGANFYNSMLISTPLGTLSYVKYCEEKNIKHNISKNQIKNLNDIILYYLNLGVPTSTIKIPENFTFKQVYEYA